jgi:rod shape-determining protein MreC
VWGHYVALQHVQTENERLKHQLDATQVDLQAQRTLADRARSLEQLLDLRDRSNLKTVAAQIVAAGASPEFRTVTIDRGTGDDLHANMAVISPAGVVGRIVIPGARASKVQLLVDRNAAVGALVERSRAQGLVTGAGDSRLRLEYVSDVADVVVGDLLVTSGIDGIYPKGYPIGRVETVERGSGGYKRILVRPAVDFSSIEEVLVVLAPAPLTESGEGTAE